MTHDQTTPAPVEVTQADKDRAAKFISESDGDFAELAALLAAHRIAHSAPAGEVVAMLYSHPEHYDEVELGTTSITDDDKAAGWTETPLYTHPAPPADLVELVEACRSLWNALDSCVDLTPSVIANFRAALAKHTRAQGEG